jgi:hypothetical protein
MGVSSHEVCGVDEFSCLAAPCYFESRGVIDGMGILKRLSKINISIEEMSG